MPQAALVDQLAAVAARRLGGNLRLLAVYGTAADNPLLAHDIDFLMVVDDVACCAAHASRDCRDLSPNVQFFILSTPEYAALPAFYRFQFAFARALHGDLPLPAPTRADAAESITHGFTDTLHTLRRQFKRREWAIGDDWARQVWWHLKSAHYAALDCCWLLRGERPRDPARASLILSSAGLTDTARVVAEWPELEAAALACKREPLRFINQWETLVASAYSEVRPLLRGK